MKLYWKKRCGSFAPEAVAAEAGLELDKVEITFAEHGGQSAELARLNPMAQVPVLRLDDGTVMTESAAISLFLAELNPEAGLLPPVGSAQRAVALRWLLYLSSEVYPADLREAYSARYVETPACADSVRRAAEARLDRDWQILGESLGPGPYLLGARFCVTDIYLCMLLAWHRAPKEVMARAPKLQRLLEATVARPAIAPLWERNDLGRRL